ncbi:hypothetical protein [Arthrobacter sp. Leaf337]|uniref:hypothetical protein n=1 Tax=Arthrobacter sp. Leaf337 TaxID=1736342 RepID=UPI000ACC69BF|nr:hypothetical protein [Arthrobacter sp. Leaf337]
MTTEHPASHPSSLEAIVVSVLPDDERQLLRSGAVLRYITRDLAKLATGTAERAQQLMEHPLVQGGTGGRQEGIWTIPEPLRRELIRDWRLDAEKTWERISTSSDELEAIYALLAVDRTRSEGLRRLESEFERAINSPSIAVGDAHDLLRMLDEWPVREHAEAQQLRDRLSPRLRRYARALRDREASEGYFERDFEHDVKELLLGESDQWMLQLHAPGGRGKSMFLKNLLGRTCPSLDIPVAWIDFDHIDRLGISTTQPWRLLLTIAHQLDQQLPHSPFSLILDSYSHLRAAIHTQALPRIGSTAKSDDTSTDEEVVAQAADEVPRKFRTQLTEALGDGIVVIAVDTVENVQHADGAEIDPVLAALADVRHGSGSKSDRGVPGFRVIVSGRFDLENSRIRLDGSQQPRSAEFHHRLLGPDVLSKALKDTVLRIGQQAISVEVPRFSDDEARRFLTRSPMSLNIVDAIVSRSSGNPMKLALFAEYVEQNPSTTASEIDTFQSVELAYLVTRVVDRISNGLVQWLLRWGALMKILTKETVDQIIWPALEELVVRGAGYDDVTTDKTPKPAPGVVRWQPPTVDEVRRQKAADFTWDELLTYAASSSWVSTLEDAHDAVQFHPEVRDPLRNLLRSEGNPVFNDIHRRALRYWQGVASEANGQSRSAAMRCVVFHAYEVYDDATVADGIWYSLLNSGGISRIDRAEIADELLAVSARLRESNRLLPSPDVVGLAHLERGEALVHQASTTGQAVDEGGLSWHRHGINQSVRTTQLRRTTFLDAVMDLALESVDKAWQQVHSALRYPAPANEENLASLELIVEWAQGLTPPRSALETAHLLHRTALGTPFAKLSARPLARALLGAERWTSALDVARSADSADLIAQALLGLGQADEVLGNRSYPAEARAAAALLKLDTVSALRELQVVPVEGSSGPSPSAMLLRGKAHALRRENELARSALSQAASGSDYVVAFEANLLLSRLMSISGDWELSLSNLNRTLQRQDLVANSRAEALNAVVASKIKGPYSADQVRVAYASAAKVEWIEPSVQVELECARLAVLGPTNDLLEDLADALARVDGPAARLQSLQWLVEVPATNALVPPSLARRLRTLTDVRISQFNAPASLVLAYAELERILGNADRASEVLDALTKYETNDPATLELSLDDARHRLDEEKTGWRSFAQHSRETKSAGSLKEEHETRMVQISSVRGGTAIMVERTVDDANLAGAGEQIEIPADVLKDGPFSLAAEPEAVFEALGHGLTFVEPMTDSTLTLDISDEAAARWPWELARLWSSMTKSGPVIRTDGRATLHSSESPVFSPEIYAAVLNERKDRGLLTDLLEDFYGSSAKYLHGDARGLLDGEIAGVRQEVRIVHLVVEPIERRRAPALQLAGEDHLTPESLTSAIKQRRPTLLILDLMLQESDSSAAEQLMLANAFCWHVVRNSVDLSVLCGVFCGASDRVDHLRLLVDGLRDGLSLGDLVGRLQRHQARLPGVRHPLRDFVSLSSGASRRQFQLGSP